MHHLLSFQIIQLRDNALLASVLHNHVRKYLFLHGKKNRSPIVLTGISSPLRAEGRSITTTTDWRLSTASRNAPSPCRRLAQYNPLFMWSAGNHGSFLLLHSSHHYLSIQHFQIQATQSDNTQLPLRDI